MHRLSEAKFLKTPWKRRERRGLCMKLKKKNKKSCLAKTSLERNTGDVA